MTGSDALCEDCIVFYIACLWLGQLVNLEFPENTGTGLHGSVVCIVPSWQNVAFSWGWCATEFISLSAGTVVSRRQNVASGVGLWFREEVHFKLAFCPLV